MQHLRISKFRSALVDDEDFLRCKIFKWNIKKNFTRRNGAKVYHEHVYAVVRVNGQDRHLHLARYILDIGDSRRIRYRSTDHLDCRKANLILEGTRQDVPRIKNLTHDEMLETIDLDVEDFVNARRASIRSLDGPRA